jgi:hypothetical protein
VDQVGNERHALDRRVEINPLIVCVRTPTDGSEAVEGRYSCRCRQVGVRDPAHGNVLHRMEAGGVQSPDTIQQRKSRGALHGRSVDPAADADLDSALVRAGELTDGAFHFLLVCGIVDPHVDTQFRDVRDGVHSRAR